MYNKNLRFIITKIRKFERRSILTFKEESRVSPSSLPRQRRLPTRADGHAGCTQLAPSHGEVALLSSHFVSALRSDTPSPNVHNTKPRAGMSRVRRGSAWEAAGAGDTRSRALAPGSRKPTLLPPSGAAARGTREQSVREVPRSQKLKLLARASPRLSTPQSGQGSKPNISLAGRDDK